MLTVHRYHLNLVDKQTLDLPAGATLLHVEHRPWSALPDIDLWAQVDTEQPTEQRHIRVAGTGHPLDPHLVHSHLGTVLLTQQRLVFHVYEINA